VSGIPVARDWRTLHSVADYGNKERCLVYVFGVVLTLFNLVFSLPP
jgi:hypothetical protein